MLFRFRFRSTAHSILVPVYRDIDSVGVGKFPMESVSFRCTCIRECGPNSRSDVSFSFSAPTHGGMDPTQFFLKCKSKVSIAVFEFLRFSWKTQYRERGLKKEHAETYAGYLLRESVMLGRCGVSKSDTISLVASARCQVCVPFYGTLS
ncbi:hypothetical protein TNIN_430331 [Trichonephila inaurata madagascariensis]|uniref:Uncharacterized protein n=1 Tax=Trichonephila inaurata madagascariensis TaxID=2747483 RepID=A0A8X6IX03_9ARAC|nr:hypothetical protein TNIN_430331 [Trichonephila inaurata madagascariensis]